MTTEGLKTFKITNIENSKLGNSRFGLLNIENSRFSLPNIETSGLGN